MGTAWFPSQRTLIFACSLKQCVVWYCHGGKRHPFYSPIPAASSPLPASIYPTERSTSLDGLITRKQLKVGYSPILPFGITFFGCKSALVTDCDDSFGSHYDAWRRMLLYITYFLSLVTIRLRKTFSEFHFSRISAGIHADRDAVQNVFFSVNSWRTQTSVFFVIPSHFNCYATIVL